MPYVSVVLCAKRTLLLLEDNVIFSTSVRVLCCRHKVLTASVIFYRSLNCDSETEKTKKEQESKMATAVRFNSEGTAVDHSANR